MSADNPGPPVDPARLLLQRARSRRPRRTTPGTPAPDPSELTWSGPGADARDPALLADALAGLVADRSWRTPLDVASLERTWPDVVGPDIASHCRPVSVVNSVLTLQADSTAWATQLRLIGTAVLAAVTAVVGEGGVTSLTVLGPTGPSWRHGPLHISGAGPRDTYG